MLGKDGEGYLLRSVGEWRVARRISDGEGEGEGITLFY